ncbi:MAG: PQQ-binding-like beta-propeller repeat protein [Kiritimatiellae bacterium]|nr:PQQ-binding-like beta-propeller repeat protein [Kiritimatiellia bacterium]MDD5519829.1 PQQ-binding-like beta-propeller repeat protein [Kiritimatiellia bacterium]
MRTQYSCLLIPACLSLVLFSYSIVSAEDWTQWCGSDGKNMVSDEKGIPDSFVPGEKDLEKGMIKIETAKNVKWGVKLCNAIYSTPAITGGKIFIGGRNAGAGLLMCLDEQTGKLLWKWEGPERKIPLYIDGWLIGIGPNPEKLGVCSSPTVDGNKVYFVTHSFKVMCLDVNGQTDGPDVGKAKVVWEYDMWDKLGVFPCDAANSCPLIDGDLLYVLTSNGVDRNMDPYKEKGRKIPAPNVPNVIVLDKKNGRLVATDDLYIADRILHGQWSSLSLGMVNGRKLIFFGGGDGLCYAFEALSSVPEKQVKLKTVWWYDCVPPEYKLSEGMDEITYFCLGDKRTKGSLNKNDGTFVGRSEIIATPVFLNNRIYVAIGRDPEHGRGRGALHCIDATREGDITKTGRIWSYQGLDRTLSTVSIADGLLYIADVGGNIHCLDAETGKLFWVHEVKGVVWSSTFVVDGKIYLGTPKGLIVLATGKEKKEIDLIILGSPLYSSPVVANGTLYAASKGGWLWAVKK